MSKLHQPHGRADADTAKGELRKPDDYSDQPEQHPDDRIDTERTHTADAVAVGTAPREYGHSSGDRNTKQDEHDWTGFTGGTQRNAPPDPPSGRAKRAHPKY